MDGALAPHSVLYSWVLAMTKHCECINSPGPLLTVASNGKKLSESPNLTMFEAGPGLDGRFSHIQAVVAAGPFDDDTISTG